MNVANVATALLTVAGFCLGLLCLKPLEMFSARLEREPLSPERRKVLSTVCCGVCLKTVEVASTEWSFAHGHTCTKHHIASAETLQAAA